MTTIRTIPNVRIETTAPRATPAPLGRRFRESLQGAASTLLSGIESASSVIPGGPVVSAAVRGLSGSAEGPGAGPSDGFDAESLRAGMKDDNMRFLLIQEQLQAENRRFSTMSNVMKARHETAKNAINNIR